MCWELSEGGMSGGPRMALSLLIYLDVDGSGRVADAETRFF